MKHSKKFPWGGRLAWGVSTKVSGPVGNKRTKRRWCLIYIKKRTTKRGNAVMLFASPFGTRNQYDGR